MKEQIKTQKGFIQIPLSIGIIISVVAVSIVTTGVVLYRQGKLTPFIANVSQVFQETKELEPEIKSEEPKIEQEQSLLEETNQEENSQTAQELEQAKLEAEKAKQEAERAKAETERLKAEQEANRTKAEAEKLKAEQEAQRIAEEEQMQEEQKRKELEKKQAEEKERIANIKIVDEGLYQLISEIQERADIFSQAKNEADSFISTVRNTMNKYPDSSLMQQSGQQLINELDDFSFIAGKLVSIENSRIRTLSSFLGSGNIPSSNDFLFSKSEYNNYFDQYNISDAKIDSLIETFVSNEKIVLEEKLERKEKVNQTLDQLAIITQEIDSQLTILDNQIKEKEAKIESIKENPWLSQASMEAQIAKVISELNPLIDQWNSLFNTRKKIVAITYKLDDYAEYGTPLSAEDRTFLWSLGISF